MSRGYRGTVAPNLLLWLLLCVLAVGCSPRAVATATPSPSAGPASLAPSSALPTPIPTARGSAAPTGSEDPITTEEPPPAGLVIRRISCSDTCGPAAGTTILDDGRIMWENALGQVRESRLTEDALEQVRRAIGDI